MQPRLVELGMVSTRRLVEDRRLSTGVESSGVAVDRDVAGVDKRGCWTRWGCEAG